MSSCHRYRVEKCPVSTKRLGPTNDDDDDTNTACGSLGALLSGVANGLHGDEKKKLQKMQTENSKNDVSS